MELIKLGVVSVVTISLAACFVGAFKWFIVMVPAIGFWAALAGAIAWLIWALKT